jgi:hypothetical protein
MQKPNRTSIILFYLFAVLFILINISIFIFFDLTDFHPLQKNNLYNPKPQTGALETTIYEKGFNFYFAIKRYYTNKNLILPDAEIIDLKVLDRLTFMRAVIKDYPYSLSCNHESLLLQMKPEKIFFFPKIRHPASRKNIDKKRIFYFIQAPEIKQTDIYYFSGKNYEFFIPETIADILIQKDGEFHKIDFMLR